MMKLSGVSVALAGGRMVFQETSVSPSIFVEMGLYCKKQI
jgi:hypothetical protein